MLDQADPSLPTPESMSSPHGIQAPTRQTVCGKLQTCREKLALPQRHEQQGWRAWTGGTATSCSPKGRWMAGTTARLPVECATPAAIREEGPGPDDLEQDSSAVAMSLRPKDAVSE